MTPWLTDETIPDEPTCFRVYVPDSDQARRAFFGALSDLERATNWELFGAITPAVMAERWQSANLKTIPNMEPCMRIGTIFFWPAGGGVPNALLCDGSLHDVDEYNELWKLIGWSYGGTPGGDFGVPNLIDLFVMGTDTGLADTGGEAEHTLSVGEMPSHDHEYSRRTQLPFTTAPGPVPLFSSSVFTDRDTSNTGGGNPHENRPPFMKLRPFIHAK